MPAPMPPRLGRCRRVTPTSAEHPDGTQAIRMMGGNLWQRSTLTANNGVYYVDTAAGPVKQMASPFKNIFEGNRTYYLLFVYATPRTHQVYHLWLGANLPVDYAEQNVFLTRAFPGGSHFQLTDDHSTWPPGWGREYDQTTGILTVTIDMGFPKFQTEFDKAQEDYCQPASFCTFGAKGCRCNEDGAFAKICKDNDICANWAGKDVDWPDGGVYGVGVTFPENFMPDEQDHRPPAKCVLKDTPGWNVPLVYTKETLRGACANTPISPPLFCQ